MWEAWPWTALLAEAGGSEGLCSTRPQTSCQWSVALPLPFCRGTLAGTLEVWTIDYLWLLQPGTNPVGGGRGRHAGGELESMKVLVMMLEGKDGLVGIGVR